VATADFVICTHDGAPIVVGTDAPAAPSSGDNHDTCPICILLHAGKAVADTSRPAAPVSFEHSRVRHDLGAAVIEDIFRPRLYASRAPPRA
jgi:hypothetical protein